MKKTLITLLFALSATLLFSQTTIAHPGNTASDGCHYCRTNCSSWGYTYGARHCHGGGSSYTPSYSLPSYSAPSVPSTPSCPFNSYYSYLDSACTCNFGYININGFCKNADIYCHDELGYNSDYSSLSKSCECDYGYYIYNGQCTSTNNICKAKYGYNSESTYDDKCQCKSGYVWNSAGTACVYSQISTDDTYINSSILLEQLLDEYNAQDKCGQNSEPSSDGKCLCEEGYEWASADPSDLDCVEEKITCGTNQSLGNDDKCYCNSGYFWSEDNKKCVTKTNWCREEYGIYSYFNTSKSSCACKSGYEFDSDASRCIERAEPVEVSSNDSESDLSGKYDYYKIRKQIGCRDRDPQDARCFWKRIDLVYAKEMLGKTDIDDVINESDVNRISYKIGVQERRYAMYCEDATEPARYCSALGKLVERGKYFLNK